MSIKNKSVRSTIIGAFVLMFIIIMAVIPIDNQSKASTPLTFHTAKELKYYSIHNISPNSPPDDSTTYFKTSSWCSGCHGSDPLDFAMHDSEGNDINTFDDWRATMMANSAKDPFWRAKVSHEVLVNPAHKDDIENTCTSCHAPMGHYNAFFMGESHYTMDDLLADTIGLDGVSCVACHQMSAEGIGALNTGQINYDTTDVLYGPYGEDVFAGPMEIYVGAEPVYGAHINDAGLCASCHTLVVETLDLDGNPTGGELVEQATYQEWVNSNYPFNGISCQACHMPRVEDSIVIATGYANLDHRYPFGRHELAGANVFMLNLIKNNLKILDIDAAPIHFDSVMAATTRMLKQRTLDSELEHVTTENDTAYFKLTLTNKAGHKFPSGYPSRIAFVEFQVLDDDGNTLFHSGKIGTDNQVEHVDPNFEPHYDVITKEEQVQIYEVVNGDVNGVFSTVLSRGAMTLKDNRLPPIGFRKDHFSYDTVAIIGEAFSDDNFNIELPPTETDPGGGNGTDIIHYHIPLNGFSGMINVVANVHYQSLPPRWMEEMFNESTPEINLFENMYNNADPSIVLISQDELNDIMVEASSTEEFSEKINLKIFPNPTIDGKIFIRAGVEINSLIIRAVDGKEIARYLPKKNQVELNLPNINGMYYLDIQTQEGSGTFQVIRE